MTTAPATPLLQVDGLRKSYPGATTPAIDGLALRVAPGEIYGLLGPNGAGKTTTLSILATRLPADAGSVHFGDDDLLRQPQRVRPFLGLVPQELALYDSLTVAENLRFFGRLYGIKGTALRQAVDQALARVGLEERANALVRTLSGGMQRRLNLAAGILHRPRLLFLDEPTVGVDAASRSRILQNLQQLRDEGMSMVYTTHYMEEAAILCDRVGVMNHGRLLAEGTPVALVAQVPGAATLEDVFFHHTGRHLQD